MKPISDNPALRIPGRRCADHPADDRSDPSGFGVLLARYLDAVAPKYSPGSMPARRRELRRFVAWAAERDLRRPSEITRVHVESYQRMLHHHRKGDGEPLGLRSQQNELGTVQLFFRWLSKQRWILFDPAEAIELPRAPRRLPRAVLSAGEAERVLNAVDLSEPLGLRDRAIVETLYSTAIRRAELVALELRDLDRSRGTLRIRKAKAGAERMVPIGARAVAWVERYLAELRPKLLAAELGLRGSGGFGQTRDSSHEPATPNREPLFLRADGQQLSDSALDRVVRLSLKRAGLAGRGRSHLFRHTCATLMLEGGADIRYIQAMLGHSELSTTQIYTRVSIAKLKAVHTASHPGAQLRRVQPGAPNLAAAAENTNVGEKPNDDDEVDADN